MDPSTCSENTRSSRREPGSGSSGHREADPRSTFRRLRFSRTGLITLIFLMIMSLVTGCLGPVTKLKKIEAVRFPETSDPFVVADRATKSYYMYGSNNHLRAPITILSSMEAASSLTAKNAVTREGMPTKPAWTKDEMQLWAPTVVKLGKQWIMYFAADRVNPPQPNNAQCIGRAMATSPAGPFKPEPKPYYCGLGGTGGALDPDVFVDPQGRVYLLMALGNTESPIHIVQLNAAGAFIGAPKAILKRQHAWEYHFIERPSMIYDPKHKNYVLAYSAGKWWEPRYSTGVAACTTPMGPCYSDKTGPWIASSNGRTAPGGLSFFRDLDGAPRAIFSTFATGKETTNGGRSASVMFMKFDPALALTVVK